MSAEPKPLAVGDRVELVRPRPAIALGSLGVIRSVLADVVCVGFDCGYEIPLVPDAVARIASPADPADDAAWPLPEGWRWNSRFAYKADDYLTAWVEDGAMRILNGHTARVPLDVVRTLLARWEAGRADE